MIVFVQIGLVSYNAQVPLIVTRRVMVEMGIVIIQLPSQMLAKRCVMKIETVLLPVIAIKVPLKKRVAVMMSTRVHHQVHQAHQAHQAHLVRVTLMLRIVKNAMTMTHSIVRHVIRDGVWTLKERVVQYKNHPEETATNRSNHFVTQIYQKKLQTS